MITLSTKARLTCLALLVLGGALVITLEFTGWTQLEAVTLNGVAVEDPEGKLGLVPGRRLLEQPIDSMATGLLNRKGIVKVDVAYDLPGRIRVTTNRFEPASFVLDRKTGRLLGLNVQGRVVPMLQDQANWEHPILTGVNAGGLFELCRDERVVPLVEQLQRLHEDNIDLYRLIDQIDLTSPDYVTITMAGLPYTLKANAAEIYRQTTDFIRFIENYERDIADTRELDLRYDDMIVQVARGK
ncbi:MAG: hypothetical protein KKA42_06185 [candidate division Zixibacteria bacterium]|nr:hypothetical protein [candidate division Zixibacteria bacterium]